MCRGEAGELKPFMSLCTLAYGFSCVGNYFTRKEPKLLFKFTMAPASLKKKHHRMVIKKRHIVSLVAFVLAGACGNGRAVRLSLDFSKRAEWRYSLRADISGISVSADTQRTFASSAQCTLSGKADANNPNLLHANVAWVSVSSNILGNAELMNLEEQAKAVRLSWALADGVIVPEDSLAAPQVRIGEWDLCKDLAKTIPALPNVPLRAGSMWERERTMPLDTKRGNAVGHLYQSFLLDSLFVSDGSTRAALSWKFIYRVEFRDHGATGLPTDVPPRGSGTGSAIVNVTNKTLDRASMLFEVPAATNGAFRISWKEAIELHLAN